jgi:hypothetical protein
MIEQPVEITLHRQSRELELAFSDDSRCRLSYELLRVHSPSAEVRGHCPGQEVLQIGKQDVNVLGIEPVGSFAMKSRSMTATAAACTLGNISSGSKKRVLRARQRGRIQAIILHDRPTGTNNG